MPHIFLWVFQTPRQRDLNVQTSLKYLAEYNVHTGNILMRRVHKDKTIFLIFYMKKFSRYIFCFFFIHQKLTEYVQCIEGAGMSKIDNPLMN